MPRLSIILPVLGNPTQMEDSLVSVLANRPSDCEILVVLNQAYDDPYDLKDEVCFVKAPPGSRWVESANLGFAMSRAPILLLLPCGVEVHERWSDEAVADFEDPAVAAVVPVVLDRRDWQRVVAAGAAYHPGGKVRKLSQGVPPPAVGPASDALVDPDLPVAFYRKSALEMVGRLSDTLGDRLASLDLALALKHAGFRCILEPRCRVYADPSAIPPERAFHRAWAAERLFWRWIPRAGRLRCLALHSMVAAAEFVRSFPRPAALTQLTGRLVGSLQMAVHRDRRPSVSKTHAELPPGSISSQGPHFRLESQQGKEPVAGNRPRSKTPS